jgi:endoglucanase
MNAARLAVGAAALALALATGAAGGGPFGASAARAQGVPPAPPLGPTGVVLQGLAQLAGQLSTAPTAAPGDWHAELLTPQLLRLWRRGGDPVHTRTRARDIEVRAEARGEDGPQGPIAVEELGFHVLPVDKEMPPWPPRILLRREVYARLAAPVPAHAELAVTARLAGKTTTHRVRFDPQAVSPFLKVNQLGFLPEDPGKAAHLAGFLGTLGALPVSPTDFQVLDAATGAVAWSGRSEPQPRAATAYGERVLGLPFGAFRKPGRYVVRVEGVGRSVPFAIGADIYQTPYRDVLRAFFHHRCGTAIDAAHSPYARPTCHPAEREGCVHERFGETPLARAEKPGECRGTTGGWHDASDFGKYVPTAVVAVADLLRVATMAPDLLVDGSSGIPESGNGVPDLLDEVAWELDWILTMQRDDGGVYHKVNTRKWADGLRPAEDRDTRWLAEVTTHDTARAAAALAAGARHLRPFDEARAERYAAAAKTAWAFLEAHPEPIPKEGFRNRDWTGGGEYGDRFGDADERAWAAVELYALTGEDRYHQAYLTRLPEKRNPRVPPLLVRDWPPTFEDVWRYAHLAYATLPRERAVDAAVVKDIGAAWRARAEDLVGLAGRDPYGLTWTPPDGDGSFGYGQTNGVRYARDLLQTCWLLGPQPPWIEHALRNLDVFFGANGTGHSYLTGTGARAVTRIEYRLDELDDVDAPLPGHPVDGPASFVHASDRSFEPELVPNGKDYPPLQRYFDFPDAVLNEPTIDEMGAVAIPLALLASPAFRARLTATLPMAAADAPAGP